MGDPNNSNSIKIGDSVPTDITGSTENLHKISSNVEKISLQNLHQDHFEANKNIQTKKTYLMMIMLRHFAW